MCAATYILVFGMFMADAPATPSADPSFRALELHDKGQRCYENADVHCAIKLWTLAYHELDGHQELLSQQTTLVFLITSAQLEAFELDTQIDPLQAAQQLLKNHLHKLAATDEGNRKTMQERLQIIEEKLMQSQSTNSATKPGISTKPQKIVKKLTIGGSVLGGIGLSLMAVMGVGIHLGLAADRNINRASIPMTETEKNQVRTWIRQGTRANQLAYGAGISGGILIVAAIPMIATGQFLKRKQVLVAPVLAPSFSGLHFVGYF